MEGVLNLYKERGETPLKRLERERVKRLEFRDKKMTYAGRLDPMAEGVLLILVGEETKNKEKYLNLNKEYEVEVLFGFDTDTYDALGLVSFDAGRSCEAFAQDRPAEQTQTLSTFLGKRKWKYPPYSSKPHKGFPLFFWARKGEEVERPEREVEIYELGIVNNEFRRGEDLLREIEEGVGKVKGDFRQKEIIEKWRESIDKNKEYNIVKIKAVVSSGTYMRTLAHEWGKALGTSAIALHIKRTRVGGFRIEDSVR